MTWERVTSCPLCGSSELASWRRGCSDSTGLDGTLTYLRCTACSCRVLEHRLDEASVGQLYHHHYGPYVNAATSTNLAVVGGAGADRPLRAALARTYGSPAKGSRVLDFGCGSPTFVDAAREVGWDTVAADFTQTGISGPAASGHEVRLIDDKFWPWLREQDFTVIRLSHVIEHLYQPQERLRQLLAALAPGGQLHLITPNPDGPSSTLARRHSFFFQLVHVTLIPPSALTQAARSVGAVRTDVVLEPAAKDLWRSWLLTAGKVRSYEEAPLGPRNRVADKLLRGTSRAFDWRGRSDRYHAFIHA
jgi:2-polyprenyl-3-methyl-5-hydroxy-6-metoxy-1,4-benzoquinol methylase